jgi:hypothetical protein
LASIDPADCPNERSVARSRVGQGSAVQHVDERDRVAGRLGEAEAESQPELVGAVLDCVAKERREFVHAVDGLQNGAVRDHATEGVEAIFE